MSSLKKFSSLTSDDNLPEVHIELALRDSALGATKSSLLLPYEHPLPPVDGGIKAWSAIGGGFFALFVQFGLGKSLEQPLKPHHNLPFVGTFYAHSIPYLARRPFRTHVGARAIMSLLSGQLAMGWFPMDPLCPSVSADPATTVLGQLTLSRSGSLAFA